MIEKTEKNIPESKKEQAKAGAYIFDAGYNTVENLLYCEENKINAYIADEQDKNIYEDNKYSRSCKIDMIDGELTVRCSGDRKLQLLRKNKNKDKYTYLYKIENQAVCKECKHNKKCIKDKNKERIFYVGNGKIDNYEIIKRMHDKIRTDEGRMIYSRRMPTIEKIFGHIKKNLRFNQFNVIGLKKVGVRWSIICTAYNLMRIYNIGLQKS
jgi:hypothetical protein